MLGDRFGDGRWSVVAILVALCQFTRWSLWYNQLAVFVLNTSWRIVQSHVLGIHW
jgi:hypothetical protein